MALSFFKNRVSVAEKAFVVRQLSTMLGSGLSISQAVSTLTGHMSNRYLATVFGQIETDLEAGLSFSKAIAKHPKVFNHVFVNVVMSGEAVGKVSEVLAQMALQLEAENEFVGKFWGALYYPLVVVVGMVLVGVVMMIKIVPQFKTIFDEAHVQLPIMTRILVAVSDFLAHDWWAVLIGVAILIYAIRYYLSTPQGRLLLDLIALKIPLKLITNYYMARFTRTLALLTQSGTPIIEALGITSEVVGNRYYGREINEARDQISRGIPLSVPLSKSTIFPPIVAQMVLVGEQTGRLDQVMTNLAHYYEEETDNQLKTLSSLFEPIMLVLVGLGVAFIVFSIFVPIYSIARFQ